ncbi:MAG: hypothetical protein FJW39_09110 [Acidobacteria bacterium]|nr:hypothetical protein [Acidobacteriota bacterium]
MSFTVIRALCLAGAMVLAQEPLNNEGVIRLVKSGMSEELIINVVRQQPGTYALGATELIALKDAGVSEKIIQAMLARGKGEGGAAPVVGASTRATISEPGLYYKKGNEYLELLTEEVEWRTSGAMKSIASAGIIKKDLNGSIAGPSSRNFLTNPMEIVLAPPQGLTVNAFILLPMRANKGVREFQVGPVNQKSGVAKGAIPFGVEKVGNNQFRMVLQTPLGPGEYGILAAIPNATSTGTSKIYTFRILL